MAEYEQLVPAHAVPCSQMADIEHFEGRNELFSSQMAGNGQ